MERLDWGYIHYKIQKVTWRDAKGVILYIMMMIRSGENQKARKSLYVITVSLCLPIQCHKVLKEGMMAEGQRSIFHFPTSYITTNYQCILYTHTHSTYIHTPSTYGYLDGIPVFLVITSLLGFLAFSCKKPCLILPLQFKSQQHKQDEGRRKNEKQGKKINLLKIQKNFKGKIF